MLARELSPAAMRVVHQLWKATSRGKSRRVKECLDAWRQVRSLQELMDIQTPDGWTALSLAASSCSQKLVRWFLDCGADVNHTALDGMTPLHLCIEAAAAKEGRGTAAADIVSLLIRSGANPFQEDLEGRTPLELAACSPVAPVQQLMSDWAALELQLVMKTGWPFPKKRPFRCLVAPSMARCSLASDHAPLLLIAFASDQPGKPTFKLSLAAASLRRKGGRTVLTLPPGARRPSKLPCERVGNGGASLELFPPLGGNEQGLASLQVLVNHRCGYADLRSLLPEACRNKALCCATAEPPAPVLKKEVMDTASQSFTSCVARCAKRQETPAPAARLSAAGGLQLQEGLLPPPAGLHGADLHTQMLRRFSQASELFSAAAESELEAAEWLSRGMITASDCVLESFHDTNISSADMLQPTRPASSGSSSSAATGIEEARIHGKVLAPPLPPQLSKDRQGDLVIGMRARGRPTDDKALITSRLNPPPVLLQQPVWEKQETPKRQAISIEAKRPLLCAATLMASHSSRLHGTNTPDDQSPPNARRTALWVRTGQALPTEAAQAFSTPRAKRWTDVQLLPLAEVL